MYRNIVELWSQAVPPPPPEIKPVVLEPKTTALLMLDFVHHACSAAIRPRCIETLPYAARLLARAREHGVFVVYAIGSVTPGRSMADTLPEVAPLGHEPWVQSGPNKFLGTELDDLLRQRGIQTVIATGTSSNGAVLHTSDEAVCRGYHSVVPIDTISADNLYTEQYSVYHFTRGSRIARGTTLTTADGISFGA